MYTVFYWRGKPIIDIEQWALDNNESLIYYKKSRLGPIFGYHSEIVLGREEQHGIAPKIFYDNLHINNNWTYKEITKEEYERDIHEGSR